MLLKSTVAGETIRDDAVSAKAKSAAKTTAISATAEILKETRQRLLTADIEATLRALRP